MNIKKLKQAEAQFLAQYPGGFSDPGLAPIRKKHNIDKLTEFARANLTPNDFNRPGHIAESLVKIISRSSMVSMFEKPKFRDYVNGLARDDRALLASAYKRLLHGRGAGKALGFTEIVDLLGEAKLAKWSLLTNLHGFWTYSPCGFVYKQEQAH